MLRRCVLLFFIILLSVPALAHQPNLVGQARVTVTEPEISRAFYDNLRGKSRAFVIESPKEFSLYVNLLVPKSTNPDGRFSAVINRMVDGKKIKIGVLDQRSAKWKEFYEQFAGDYYIKGPEFKRTVPAGTYEIIVFNKDNQGKYVLAVGEKEVWGVKNTLIALTLLPRIKAGFFKTSPFSLLLTPMGIFYYVWLAAIAVVVLLLWLIARRLRKK